MFGVEHRHLVSVRMDLCCTLFTVWVGFPHGHAMYEPPFGWWKLLDLQRWTQGAANWNQSKPVLRDLSHNQNPVLKWSTQNHVRNQAGGYPQLFMVGDRPLLTFTCPGFDCGSPENERSGRNSLVLSRE